jgi:glutaredoxin-related protein
MIVLLFCFSQRSWADGFVTLPPSTALSINNPPANNPYPDTVVVSLVPNCPAEAGQYARTLVYYLEKNGFEVMTTAQVSFKFDSQEAFQQINDFMTSAAMPQVFINGRAMGRPSYDEIIQEMRAQHNAGYGFN